MSKIRTTKSHNNRCYRCGRKIVDRKPCENVKGHDAFEALIQRSHRIFEATERGFFQRMQNFDRRHYPVTAAEIPNKPESEIDGNVVKLFKDSAETDKKEGKVKNAHG